MKLLSAIREIIRKEGTHALYRGASVRLAHYLINSVFTVHCMYRLEIEWFNTGSKKE